MRDSILAKIFRRVQVNASERRVLDVILSKANMYGKHAKVAHEVIQAITGLTAAGRALVGVGFTATPGGEQLTYWRSLTR